MDFLFGIKGKDFVMVCSDTCASQQIITIKHDEDKLVPIDSHKLICISGARCWSVKEPGKLRKEKTATCLLTSALQKQAALLSGRNLFLVALHSQDGS